MAWGGLTVDNDGNEYDFFKSTITDPDERERIREVLQIEQTGKDLNDYPRTQKGKDSGC